MFPALFFTFFFPCCWSLLVLFFDPDELSSLPALENSYASSSLETSNSASARVWGEDLAASSLYGCLSPKIHCCRADFVSKPGTLYNSDFVRAMYVHAFSPFLCTSLRSSILARDSLTGDSNCFLRISLNSSRLSGRRYPRETYSASHHTLAFPANNSTI